MYCRNALGGKYSREPILIGQRATSFGIRERVRFDAYATVRNSSSSMLEMAGDALAPARLGILGWRGSMKGGLGSSNTSNIAQKGESRKWE
jgi:hypothetical protein